MYDQGENLNVLNGQRLIIRLTSMTAILSALSIGSSKLYGLNSPDDLKKSNISDSFDAFSKFNEIAKSTGQSTLFPKLNGTVPLNSILNFKPMAFSSFFQKTSTEKTLLEKEQDEKFAILNRSPKYENLIPITSIEEIKNPKLNHSKNLKASLANEPFKTQLEQIVFDNGEMDRHAAKNIELIISETKGSLNLNLDKIKLLSNKSKISIILNEYAEQNFLNNKISMFVRNPEILSFKKESMELTPRKNGNTELYIINGSQSMTIVPIAILAKSDSLIGSTVSKSLVSLNSLLPKLTPSDDISGPNSLLHHNNLLASIDTDLITPQGSNDSNKIDALDDVPSIDPSEETFLDPDLKKEREEDAKIWRQDAFESAQFKLEKKEVRKSRTSIQIVDERSKLFLNRYYPVQNVSVKVIGSKYQGKTNSSGKIALADVPSDSSFLVEMYDNAGKYFPTISEVNLSSVGDLKNIPIKTLTQKNFSLYSDAFGIAQQSQLSSFCANLNPNKKSKNSYEDVGDLKVRINKDSEGPFYFNNNLPSPTSNSTDSHGRFCFFNIEPGLVEIEVTENSGQFVTGISLPLFSGKHLEDEITIQTGLEFQTQLATIPNAQNQLFNNNISLSDYKSVDNVDLLLLGEQSELHSESPSIMSIPKGYSSYKGTIHLLAKGSEFESTLFSFSSSDSNKLPVTPILPRGFIEDLHQELYNSSDLSSDLFDASLGSAVVFFGHNAKDFDKSVNIKLVDQFGKDVESGWYFGSGLNKEKMTKAVFFNLNPGIYTVVVESESGIWLDSKTLPVDFWTVSIASVGNQVYSFPTNIK